MAEQPSAGKRDQAEVAMRQSFLASGKVPLGLALRKGFVSLLRDPWLMFLQGLPGPIGFKLRQLYYGRRLGHMGKGVVIGPSVNLIEPRNIYLDDFVYLDRGTNLESPEGYIKIGKRCHLLTTWVLGHGGVEIGNYVGSGGSILSVTDTHQGGYRMAGPMIPPEQRRLRYGKVVIEDNAFIGHYSIVMPGVTVGEGAVIAPHSFVITSVKPWTIVMGSPARMIAKREPIKFPPPD